MILESIIANPLLVVVGLVVTTIAALYLRFKGDPVPPGTPSLPQSSIPLAGCLPFFIEEWERLPDTLTKFDAHFNKTWFAPVPKIGMLGGGVYSISDEKCVNHILKENFDNYEKGANFRDALGEFLGDGIFASDGKQWKHHRKVASNMFSRNLMRNGTVVAVKQLAKVVEKLDQVSNSNGSIDMQDLFFRMTIDVFSSIAFGVELNSILADKVHPFAAAFDTVQNLSQKRFKDPLWTIKRFFQASVEERTIRKEVGVMNDFAHKVITDRRRDTENSDNLGPDLLSRFLDCKDPKDIPSSTELRDIVMNFLIAGRDTTACALSWTMYELARHPEVRAKVIAECNSVCAPSDEAGGTRGRTFSDVDYSYDKIGELRYTHAVAMEVLRLHPSVPVEVKFSINKDTLPDGTHIHPGASCIYSPYAMGRSKKIWGEDAEQFKPERMLDEEGKNIEPGQFKYTTFNAGPRLCLGKGLALMEIKLALAILLQRFDFEIDGKHEGGYDSTLVLPMKPGLMMKVRAKK